MTMSPIIGVVPSIDEDKGQYFINEDNVKSLSEAGGIPVLLPYFKNESTADELVERIDGLYLTGGNDINPFLFGEEPHQKLGVVNQQRDEFEMILVQKVLQKNKPVLGVCKGCQIINVALGGSVYQDIYDQIDSTLLQHHQQASDGYPSHFVHVTEGSLLSKIVGSSEIKVNSRHHQAIKRLGNSLVQSGTANDGIIEAIESKDYRYVLGVQWHPENMAMQGDDTSKKIFDSFIEACSGIPSEAKN